MAFLGKWRSRIGSILLKRKLQKQSIKRRTLAFDKVKTIALLAQGTDSEHEEWSKLVKKVFGNDITINWVWLSKEKESVLVNQDNILLLDSKSSSFFYQVKGDLLHQFDEQKNEVILCLENNPSPLLVNLLALSRADFRVGYMSEHEYSFELMLDMNGNANKEHFIRTAYDYIKLMNPS